MRTMKMKNKFLIALCLLAFFSTKEAYSQIHFMMFGGFNTSKIITEFEKKEVILSEARESYILGGGFRVDIGRVLYLQPEVYVTRKGGLEQVFRKGAIDSLNQDAIIESVDVPLMVGLRLFEKNGFNFRIYGGPVVSFLQEPKVTSFLNGVSIPIAEMEQTHVFSMQFGAGVDLKFVTLDVRYEYACSPMLSFQDFKTRTKILYFTVGFKIF